MATKTKDLIIDSFLKICEEKDIAAEKVSITDIVEECQISRQTFYYHFKDVEEMLVWAFDNETEKIINNMYKYDNWQESLILYEGLFKKYGVFLKKTLESRYFVFVHSLLYNSISNFSRIFLEKKKNARIDEQIDFIIDVYSYALIGFIIKELKKDNSDFNAMINEIIKNLSAPQK